MKGLDLLISAGTTLLRRGAQLAVLGSGEQRIEQGFDAAAAHWPGRVAVRHGYDEPLAHLLQGGADAIVVPSRTEPCGLTQMYGLRYGTIPVVRRTGGLADSVVDANAHNLAHERATGVVFNDMDADALAWALGRTIDLYHHKPLWHAMVRRAMQRGLQLAQARPPATPRSTATSPAPASDLSPRTGRRRNHRRHNHRGHRRHHHRSLRPQPEIKPRPDRRPGDHDRQRHRIVRARAHADLEPSPSSRRAGAYQLSS
jgi:hypothetical protein